MKSNGAFRFTKRTEKTDLLRAPIWCDLCLINGRPCIEGGEFTLALNGQQGRIRIVTLKKVVRAKAQKVYIILENRAQYGNIYFINNSLHNVNYRTLQISKNYYENQDEHNSNNTRTITYISKPIF
jgi:hypothetical protein